MPNAAGSTITYETRSSPTGHDAENTREDVTAGYRMPQVTGVKSLTSCKRAASAGCVRRLWTRLGPWLRRGRGRRAFRPKSRSEDQPDRGMGQPRNRRPPDTASPALPAGSQHRRRRTASSLEASSPPSEEVRGQRGGCIPMPDGVHRTRVYHRRLPQRSVPDTVPPAERGGVNQDAR